MLQILKDKLSADDLAFLGTLKCKQLNRLSVNLNQKIQSKEVGIFNLQAVKDCLNCNSCKSTCYAVQRELMFSNVRASRKFNSDLANKRPNLLLYLLYRQITNQKLSIVRLHEAGDFVTTAYIDMLCQLADLLPDVKFNTYTKLIGYRVDFNRAISKLNLKPNFNVINSFVNGKYRNYGTLEYIQRLQEVVSGTYLCPEIGCMTTCKYCLTGDKPIFKIHGNYRNKDDMKL